MPHKTYDFFVLGSGPAGQSFALSASKAGHSVGITEPLDYGGTCPNHGCDPKKVLYGAAKTMAEVIRLQGKGFATKPTISWPDLQVWKSEFTDHIPTAAKKKLTTKGVDCFDGKAIFTGKHTLQIGDDLTVEAKRIIIATGAKPAPLDIPGKEFYLDSAGFLDMEDLPKRLLVIGSGYIGSSFAQISALLGAEVTVVAADDNPVDNFDGDLNQLLVKAAKEHGITFHFKTKASSIARGEGGTYRVTCKPEEGDEFELTTDRVIHCAGRVPNIKQLQLEKAGIDFDDKGIAVNPKLCTNVTDHYAIGDCAYSGLPLTPVASHEARLLADNLFEGKQREQDYHPIPTVAFTLPPIAAVGMTAERAKEDPRNLKIKFEDTTDWFTNKHLNLAVGGYKLIIDEENDLLLGAHLLGENAQEVINLFAMAIRHKIKISDIQEMILAYPTAGADIKKMFG